MDTALVVILVAFAGWFGIALHEHLVTARRQKDVERWFLHEAAHHLAQIEDETTRVLKRKVK